MGHEGLEVIGHIYKWVDVEQWDGGNEVMSADEC